MEMAIGWTIARQPGIAAEIAELFAADACHMVARLQQLDHPTTSWAVDRLVLVHHSPYIFFSVPLFAGTIRVGLFETFDTCFAMAEKTFSFTIRWDKSGAVSVVAVEAIVDRSVGFFLHLAE